MSGKVPGEDGDAVEEHLDSEGRLVDGHKHYATTSGNVLHLFHHTVSAGRIKARGGFIKEQKQRLVDYIDPYRHPSPLSSRNTPPPFVPYVGMRRTLHPNYPSISFIKRYSFLEREGGRERERGSVPTNRVDRGAQIHAASSQIWI
ncbi:hypothetical protein LguiB_007504 [Lonicera macranthoides]